jgi:hypothetical protein
MEDKSNPGTLAQHEKFWAFLFLISMIAALVVVSLMLHSGSASPAEDVVLNAKLRIIDSAVAGLMAIGGMAAQALFRTSQSDKDITSALKTLSDKTPPVTGEAALSLETQSPVDEPTSEGAPPWTK